MSADLIARCESAAPKIQGFLILSTLESMWKEPESDYQPRREPNFAPEWCVWNTRNSAVRNFVQFGAFVDAAFLLLPASAVNADLFSHSRDGGKSAWSFRFHDTAQKMGERAAFEEIERMVKSDGSSWKISGEPRIILEKAIAEHWLEFRGTASTASLAICAAALRSSISP